MLAGFLIALAAPPTFLDDAPAGTDLVIRADTGAFAGEAHKMWDEARKLVDAWPPVKGVRDAAQAAYDEKVAPLLRQLALDPKRKGVVVVLAVDLDATGGVVYSVVVRGAGKSGKLGEGATPFTVDGIPAFRHAERDVAWAQTQDALVVGNERGLQRQLRHLSSRRTAEPALAALAEHLRKPTPFALAYVAPAATRSELAQTIPTLGPIFAEIVSAVITAKPGHVEVRLQAEHVKGEQAIGHGVRALVGAVRGATGVLEGAGEMMLGLDRLGRRPPNVPAALDAKAIESFVGTWLRGFTLAAAVRERSQYHVEASLTVSSFRGLVAALGLLAGAFVPDRPAAPDPEVAALLVALREAEIAYKQAHGQFLACGPVPAAPPEGNAPWPAASCFDPLGFRPTQPVRMQLVADVKEGELVLMARGDSNGDGLPEMWVLDEKSPAPRRLVPRPAPPPRAVERDSAGGGLQPAD